MSINLQCSWTGQLTTPSHKHLLSLTTDEGCLRITTWPPKHGRWAHAAAAEVGGWCDSLHSPEEANPKALGSCSCFYPFLLPDVVMLNARFDPSRLGSSVGEGRWDGPWESQGCVIAVWGALVVLCCVSQLLQIC